MAQRPGLQHTTPCEEECTQHVTFAQLRCEPGNTHNKVQVMRLHWLDHGLLGELGPCLHASTRVRQ